MTRSNYIQKENSTGIWQNYKKEKLRHINRYMYTSFTKIQILDNQNVYIFI